VRIEMNCRKCGSNKFALGGPLADDAMIRCLSCGHKIGTMAELKERVAAEVMKRVDARPASRPA
jgi:DNA-directed RNA polymerase subunit RPC12/RpoP